MDNSRLADLLKHIFGDVQVFQTKIWYSSRDLFIFGANTAADSHYPPNVLISVERAHVDPRKEVANEKAPLVAVHQQIIHKAMPDVALEPKWNGRCKLSSPEVILDYTISALSHGLDCVTLDTIWPVFNHEEREKIVERLTDIIERLQEVKLTDPAVKEILSNFKFETDWEVMPYKRGSIMGGPARGYFASLYSWLLNYIRTTCTTHPTVLQHPTGNLTIRSQDRSVPNCNLRQEEVTQLEQSAALSLMDIQPNNILVEVRMMEDPATKYTYRTVKICTFLHYQSVEFLPFALQRALMHDPMGVLLGRGQEEDRTERKVKEMMQGLH